MSDEQEPGLALPMPAGERGVQERSVEDAERLRRSQSLMFGLSVLRSYRGSRVSERLFNVAEALGRSRSTAHRYMLTLVALGYLERGGSSEYRLAPKAHHVGMAALEASGLREAAHEELVGLRGRTGCTARIGVLLDLDVLLVDQARSSAKGQALHAVNTRPGALLPGHCTALGKALLAEIDPASVANELQASARRRSAGLEQARSAGYAIEDEEHERALCAIAAPVRDGEGRTIAAIDILGCAPQIGLPRLLQSHTRDLIETAGRIGEIVEGQRRVRESRRTRRRAVTDPDA